MIPKTVKPTLRKGKQRLEFELKLRIHSPLLIYQMGKVGSFSLLKSLEKFYPGAVVHAHSLINNPNWKIEKLYQQIVLRKKPINIISLTREPIGRNVSAFFQNFERDTGVAYEKANFSIEELKEIFMKNYKHQIPLNWFDENIKYNFGIDVYEKEFPSCGIKTYTHDQVRLLVMKSEIDDSDKVDAIKSFLGLPEFELNSANVSDLKDYSETYKAFKNEVRFPLSYIERMCDSKYCKHFYSKDEIDAFKHRWIQPKKESINNGNPV